MNKNVIIIKQSGMNNNSDWKDEGVYINYCFRKGDYFYVGESKSFGNRKTSYSKEVMDIMCKEEDTSRSLLCYWKSKHVDPVLRCIGKPELVSDSKKPLRKIIEAAAMSNFVFDTYQKCNKRMVSISLEELTFGTAIIILSRKYPIYKSLLIISKILNDISCDAKTVKELASDCQEILNLKREYNIISSAFFDNLSKGKVIAQQGFDRKSLAVNETGYVYNSENLDIFFGDVEYSGISDYKAILYLPPILLYKKDNKFIVKVSLDHRYGGDLGCPGKIMDMILDELKKYDLLSTDVKDILDSNINFVPIL